jgi:hypothetical protein
MRLWDSLRQLRFAKDLRIAPPLWPHQLLSRLESLLDSTNSEVDEPARPPPSALSAPEPAASPSLSPEQLAQIGTGLWRLRQRMVQPGTSRPLPEVQRAFRHLESVWEVLNGAGVTIQDHTDAPFDAGQSLRVLTYQPMPELSREKVIETIKPSVYVGKKMIQMGEVIVGTPEQATSSATAPNET